MAGLGEARTPLASKGASGDERGGAGLGQAGRGLARLGKAWDLLVRKDGAMKKTRMAPIKRTIQFKVLLSDEEKSWLEDLANSKGLTPTDYVRTTIRDAYAKSSAYPIPHGER